MEEFKEDVAHAYEEFERIRGEVAIEQDTPDIDLREREGVSPGSIDIAEELEASQSEPQHENYLTESQVEPEFI